MRTPSLAFAPATIVGGYHALGDEADPALLLERLVELGCHVAFPRVYAKDAPLEFHRVLTGARIFKARTPSAFTNPWRIGRA